MAQPPAGWTLAELAERLGGELEGPADLRVLRPVMAGSDDPEGITFAESGKYLDLVKASSVGAVLAGPGVEVGDRPVIRVAVPRAAFGMLLALARRHAPLDRGVHPTAVVHPDAQLGPNVDVGPYAVVERGAVIGEGSRIFPFAYVGIGCRLGKGVVLYPHATLVQDVSLGDRTVVHSGAVIGTDGFGFVWDGKRRVKVEQAGGVSIGSDCEIGANTCIDRATCEETVLGDGVKLDNMVQIAHNVRIGDHTVMAALCGISGSTRIGSRVTIAGQAATKDHAFVGDDVVLGGRTAVFQDLTEPGEYLGLPAIPVRRELKQMSAIKKLPELLDRVKELEQRLAELEGNS